MVQPPIWGNYRSPWEIAYIKAFLQSHGHEVNTSDLAVGALPIIAEFAQEIQNTLDKTFISRVYVTSTSYLMSVAEFYLVRLFYPAQNYAYEEATRALLEFRTVFRGEELERLLHLFLTTDFFAKLDAYLIKHSQSLLKMRPAVVGCTTHTISFPIGLFILKTIKDLQPSVKTVISGYQATMIARNIFHRCPWVDFVVQGESEFPYLRILNGEVRAGSTVSAERAVCLDTLPVPDYSDLEMRQYANVSLLASRNCSHRGCVFCQENAFWGPYRYASAPKIVSDMQELYERYRKPQFDFVDLGMERFVAMVTEEMLRQRVKLTWAGCMRAENINLDTLKSLRSSGCTRLIFGLESGSPRLLKQMRKRITLSNLRKLLANIHNQGITTAVSCIAGLPNETEDDFQSTLDFIESNKDIIDMASIQSLKILPHSRLGKHLVMQKGVWGLRYAPDLRLAEVEELLCSRRFEGEPSSLTALRREIAARESFIRQGVDMSYATSLFDGDAEDNQKFLGVR